MQTKLRQELLEHSRDTDPTWDQFVNGFPYLEAVVCEVMRHHPPVHETMRQVCLLQFTAHLSHHGLSSPGQATTDDILPLSTGLLSASGEIIDRVPIAKGTLVVIPFRSVNRSAAIWGPDSKEFIPERWLDDKVDAGKAKEISGHKHTLTFGNGPRNCLGRTFALAEIKVIKILCGAKLGCPSLTGVWN